MNHSSVLCWWYQFAAPSMGGLLVFSSSFQTHRLRLKEPFQAFPKVLEKMPSVGNLNRLRRSLGGSLDVGFATITADDFHAWMRLQPRSQGLVRTLGKQSLPSRTRGSTG